MIHLTEALLSGAALLGVDAERAAEDEGKAPGIHGRRRPPNPLGEGPTPAMISGERPKKTKTELPGV